MSPADVNVPYACHVENTSDPTKEKMPEAEGPLRAIFQTSDISRGPNGSPTAPRNGNGLEARART